jgi:hypothetical protein
MTPSTLAVLRIPGSVANTAACGVPPTGTASAARIIDHEPGRPSPAWGRPYAVRGNLMGAGSNT